MKLPRRRPKIKKPGIKRTLSKWRLPRGPFHYPIVYRKYTPQEERAAAEERLSILKVLRKPRPSDNREASSSKALVKLVKSVYRTEIFKWTYNRLTAAETREDRVAAELDRIRKEIHHLQDRERDPDFKDFQKTYYPTVAELAAVIREWNVTKEELITHLYRPTLGFSKAGVIINRALRISGSTERISMSDI